MEKNKIKDILGKEGFSREDLITLLSADKTDTKLIYIKAAEVKKEYVGNKVYLRGLIELSNICSKNCYYCGIRSGNKNLTRYELEEGEIMEAIDFAYQNKYASMVIQSGERKDKKFVNTINHIIEKISEKRRAKAKMGMKHTP